MSKIELPYVTITYDAPMVILVYKEGTRLGVAEIKETVACAEKLSEGVPYVTFSDLREEFNISDQAKRYVARPSNMPLFRGAAVLVKSDLYSYVINLGAYFQKKTYPIKAFVTEERAMEWLRSLPLDAAFVVE